ncbi:hypothetical protein LFT45_03955 [Arthrobacter sp. FW305-BF8]|uniref:hypothetical protein n=1 Tax=Arthrobacter sp. FW305-BF8 TaxID=2879617 RepID=UPI001F3EA3A0|nr:hypothetical protein [Arthrobacter sp. FW305-BF8]UKA55107.1 hypothetical protein LFT45_03955 [Arthrobacter sp. FW305-BF8]
MGLLDEQQVLGPCPAAHGSPPRKSPAHGSRAHARRRLTVLAAVAMATAVPALAACTVPEPQESAGPLPITVEVNQSRDQYGKQAIQLLLTNVSGRPLTVAAAQLASPLFQRDILWEPAGGSLELPPGQPKTLPARLPAPVCGRDRSTAQQSTIQQPVATIRYSEPGRPGLRQVAPGARDPFRVLERNNRELCLAAEAAAVADIVLDRRLEVAPDSRTAVVRLVITPKKAVGAGTDIRSVTIASIDGTTLIAEPADEPWPRNIRIAQGAPRSELRLRIRPARCDPHAIAEDKVGTLLPLHVTVGGREGQLKIAAGTALRGQIYEFVTAACGPT